MPTYPIRRRPRECKTCLPCRASKVRCDRNVPCGNCVKRNFTCSYGRPPPSQPKPPVFSELYRPSSISATPQYPPSSYIPSTREVSYNADRSTDDLSETVSLSQDEWDELNSKMQAMEQILSSLDSLFHDRSERKSSGGQLDTSAAEEDPSLSSQGVYESDSLKTSKIHVGSRSALVDIMDKSKRSLDTAEVLPKDDLLTELALGNQSAAYPFVDLWSSDPYTFNIAGVCGVLPDDEQCRKFLGCYKNIGAVLYPVLPDLAKLEQDMNRLLQGRLAADGVYRPDANGLMKPFGMSIPFLSLLFAVLASGCQLSDLPESERELTSWVYVSCAYQCLRMLNYVSQPTTEIIQILLIISNVLSYNMNAGASYTLLGMTERMCMVLGLHVETPGFSRPTRAARQRAWWAMAFQNSHFSLAYDRPSITMINQPEIPYDPKSMPGHRSYFETLCRIISVVLESLRGLMMHHHSHLRYHEIRDYKQRIERIISEAAPHLRFRDCCASLQDHIERTELRLHSSYYISVMCRVSLDPDAPLDEKRRALVRDDCLLNLISTIEALQRTIASAFLLVANNHEQIHSQTWDLIQRLEVVLADHVNEEGEMGDGRTDSAKHLASSLRALREVSAAFRSGKRASAPESTTVSQTISPPDMATSPSSVNIPSSSYVAPYGVPYEDRHIGNILNRVSDVMLFPSMNTGNVF
ncbi:cellobiose response regulator [Aspergillus ambiguus]|uniref:Zn(II)2Cys6 transcription factor n=1 Tax=Aspergillus ambiguus TaxID=176160 RepID=UPI003CCE2940